MLIFDYQCPDCKRIDEVLVRIRQSRFVKCECGGMMNRLMPAPGLLKTNFADKNSVRKR